MSNDTSPDVPVSSTWPRALGQALSLLLAGVIIGIAINQRERLRQLDRESMWAKWQDVRNTVEPRIQQPGERIRATVGAAIGESAADVRSPGRQNS